LRQFGRDRFKWFWLLFTETAHDGRYYRGLHSRAVYPPNASAAACSDAVLALVRLGQLEQPFAEGPAAVPDAQFFLQAGYTLVDRAVATPAGVLGQCAGQPRLASAGGAGDQDALAGADSVTQG
jgi:hypothetical protein